MFLDWSKCMRTEGTPQTGHAVRDIVLPPPWMYPQKGICAWNSFTKQSWPGGCIHVHLGLPVEHYLNGFTNNPGLRIQVSACRILSSYPNGVPGIGAFIFCSHRNFQSHPKGHVECAISRSILIPREVDRDTTIMKWTPPGNQRRWTIMRPGVA